MNILVISGTFPPRSFGGITAITYSLAKRLVKSGHEVTVLTTDVGNNRYSRLTVQDTEKLNGITVHYFKNISNSLAFKHRLYLPIGMVLMLKKEAANFDIIHLQDFRSVFSVFVHHYAKKYNISYVLQAHGSVLPFFAKQRLKKLYDKVWGYRILKDASIVIALTNTEAEQYKKMGVDEDKIKIVPNGIDLSEYENLPDRGVFRSKYGIKSNEKIVLYLSRIHKIKGVDLLVEAFADLVNKMDDVKLVIAGPDDGFLVMLKERIADLKIDDKILFTGPIYERDKLEAYIDADVYVLPSVYETFPVSVLEACACGMPVIVTDRCGIADIIDDKVGYVVEYDKDQLRDAIFKVLSDEELRKRFGEEGKRLVRKEFGWDKVVTKVEKVYKSMKR